MKSLIDEALWNMGLWLMQKIHKHASLGKLHKVVYRLIEDMCASDLTPVEQGSLTALEDTKHVIPSEFHKVDCKTYGMQ